MAKPLANMIQHDYLGMMEKLNKASNIAANQCVIISGAGDLRHLSQFPLRSLVLTQRWRIKTKQTWNKEPKNNRGTVTSKKTYPR